MDKQVTIKDLNFIFNSEGHYDKAQNRVICGRYGRECNNCPIDLKYYKCIGSYLYDFISKDIYTQIGFIRTGKLLRGENNE